MNYFKNNLRPSLVASAVALTLAGASAQAIEITSTNDAELLANTLIIPNSGVTITNFSLLGGTFSEGGNPEGPNPEGPGTCDGEVCEGPVVALSTSDLVLASEALTTPQAGIFTNPTNVYGLPQTGGIVFSTGDVNSYGAFDPEASELDGSFQFQATPEQNTSLSSITGQTTHFDPVELNIEFDVADDVDQISFIAAFGSNEFPDFVGSRFIDGFGMFLNGVNVASALETGAEEGDDPIAININHPDFVELEGTRLNGVLAPNGVPLMRFDVPVEPGSIGNTFQLILADAGDSSVDSTIYLSSFGDFDSDGGDSEFTPVLPDPSNPTNDEGAFVITLPEVEAGDTIWFDPEIAIGYSYEATGGGLFASVTVPTLLTVNDADGYLVTYVNSAGQEVTQMLFANETLDFSVPVSSFKIEGINPDLGLDPTDFNAFVTGVSFSETGVFGVLQTPITVFVDDPTDVSAPGVFALFGLSLLGFAGLRRKQK